MYAGRTFTNAATSSGRRGSVAGFRFFVRLPGIVTRGVALSRRIHPTRAHSVPCDAARCRRRAGRRRLVWVVRPQAGGGFVAGHGTSIRSDAVVGHPLHRPERVRDDVPALFHPVEQREHRAHLVVLEFGTQLPRRAPCAEACRRAVRETYPVAAGKSFVGT